jgi:hypothetical protein
MVVSSPIGHTRPPRAGVPLAFVVHPHDRVCTLENDRIISREMKGFRFGCTAFKSLL